MNRFPTIILVAALILAVACNKSPDKAEQLAALDDAYHANLLTKEEYDAKRVALTGMTPTTTQTAEVESTPAEAASPSPSPAAVEPSRENVRPSEAAHAQPSTHAGNHAPTASLSANDVHSNRPGPSAAAGCKDAEYKSGGQKGTDERFFAATPETVRRAAISALTDLDFNIHKNSKDAIEASKKRHLGAIVGGERVILTLKETEHAGKVGTQVIGETKKNFVGHISQKTWTDAVFAEMACNLGTGAVSVH
jgi:hypothetical protein